MDWDAAHARDVAQALAEHYGFPFAEATDFLWRRQLRQAEQAGAQPPDGEDEDEEVQDAEQWGEGEEEGENVIIPMLGQELVLVSMTMGTGDVISEHGEPTGALPGRLIRGQRSRPNSTLG